MLRLADMVRDLTLRRRATRVHNPNAALARHPSSPGRPGRRTSLWGRGPGNQAGQGKDPVREERT
eukprot:790194-Lingulodinium_polyedra.AAC.1